jgi:hypothetical protein
MDGKPYGSKSALVYDNGLFVEIAARLARDFGRVCYAMPWKSAYPKAGPAHVGVGLPGVERVLNFWDHVAEADVVVFLDIYDADAQAVVREKFGKPCWGFARAEMMELDRRGMRYLQKQLGIPAPPTKFFTGIDALEEYLRGHEDKWVKVSTYRGDTETFRHQNWHTTSVFLDFLRHRVGALAETYEFTVEDDVPGVEVGYDGYTVRGEFPSHTYFGVEIKDLGYQGVFKPYSQLPPVLKDFNAKVAPLLRQEGAIGFFSLETRVNDSGEAFMIDPAARCCSPPVEGTMEGYANLSEIIFEGAAGRLVSPRALGKYVVMAMIHCSAALNSWVPIDVPEEDRQWVKFRNAAVLDGQLYHVPMGEMPEIGAVVAVSDDLDEARRLVRERAERVKGYQLDVHTEALEKAEEEVKKAKDHGIEV